MPQSIKCDERATKPPSMCNVEVQIAVVKKSSLQPQMKTPYTVPCKAQSQHLSYPSSQCNTRPVAQLHACSTPFNPLRSVLKFACPWSVGSAEVLLDLLIARQPQQQGSDLIADASDGLIIHVGLCNELWHVSCDELVK